MLRELVILTYFKKILSPFFIPIDFMRKKKNEAVSLYING